MPVMNGFKAARQLTRDIHTKHIPITLSSTKNTETDAIWAKRQGAAAYMVKPEKKEAVLSTVSAALTGIR